MKKLLGLLVGCVVAAAAFNASAALGPQTNIVQQINFTLDFTYQSGKTVLIAQKVTKSGTGSHTVFATNYLTNVTYTVGHETVLTKEVIASLMGVAASNVPVNATLVRVLNSEGDLVSYQIRHGVVRTPVTNLTMVQIGTNLFGTRSTNGVVLAGSGTDYSIEKTTLSTNSASARGFTVWGTALTTYSAVSFGQFKGIAHNSTATVAGNGTDTEGDYVIVSGTVTVNGPTVEVDSPIVTSE